MSQFHKLTVKEIKKETDNAVTIAFEVPNNLKDTFSFKAGQYITLKANLNGNEIRRDYSLCVPPKSNELKVAVKEVEDGTFSSYANNQLKAGDVLEVAPPKGRFIFEPDTSKTKTIAAFAAGSGITPILSIITCALKEDTNSNVVLVYGNKTTKDTMFLNELLELQHQYSNRLTIKFVFSQANEPNAAPSADDSNTISNDNTQITIIVDDEETSFEMSQKNTILEASLDEDLDVPYSCQGGICSSCIARLTEGKATMRQNNILTDSEIAEGLILTCQAHPTTNNIVVDYDDV